MDCNSCSGSRRGFLQQVAALDGVTIDRKTRVILVRSQGQVYAFNLSWPTPNGTFTSGHATRNMDRLNIRRDGDMLVVDLSHMLKSDRDLAGFWAAAAITV